LIRLLMFLFGKPYEVCKSCETLKQQLDYERQNNKELQATLINILKPQISEAPVVEIAPVAQSSVLFSKRRAAMEEKDRLTASVVRSSKNLAMPDNIVNDKVENERIAKLEAELGIAEEKG
jgi:hypothetical protein